MAAAFSGLTLLFFCVVVVKLEVNSQMVLCSQSPSDSGDCPAYCCALRQVVDLIKKSQNFFLCSSLLFAEPGYIATDFISVDCGLADRAYYVAPLSGITYISDASLIDTGVSLNISAAYATVTTPQRFLNVRSFPDGARNCYTFKSLTAGLKYLVRAAFLYGNYDAKNSSSVQFDLHLDVNFWKTINITNQAIAYSAEAIVQATTNVISVCFVNTGHGTPFVSSLELRPMNRTLYPLVDASRSLVLESRNDLARAGAYVRFPTDRHDRIWQPFSDSPSWTRLSTNLTVESSVSDQFEAPSVVMQTAIVPVNSTKLEVSLAVDNARDGGEYYAILYFSELQSLLVNESRQFLINLGEIPSNGGKPFSPEYLSATFVYNSNPSSANGGQYDISLVATGNSTLPPLLNAVEVYSAMKNTTVPSYMTDVTAMIAIKEAYTVKRNWQGDPCVPKAYTWDGLNCTSNVSGGPRITAVNISSSGLTGEIVAAFANLSRIQYLDLSHNQLTGPIPAILAYLPDLKFLNLADNELNGLVPSALLAKSQNGTLTLRLEGNPNICLNATSCQTLKQKKKVSLVIILVASVVPALLLLMAVALCILRKKQKRTNSMTYENEYALSISTQRFTYAELKKITRNFERVLGKGGFGTVYHGHSGDGKEVAVKMLTHSSSQEFVAEAQNLSRVHHKNLVAMLGYCIDGDHLALVYEYMSQGTLKEHLRGSPGFKPLTWNQRIRIAIEAAQGLEYLHTACKPPLIHRDVKTTNILLNEKLEAKISDFGLSRAFEDEDNSHISTRVVGTAGYLDPEYYVRHQLTEKSDVYSFGVVLLELITGQPPILFDRDREYIVQWACDRLAEGKIEEVVDQCVQGNYNANSAWNVAYVALNCALPSCSQRPTMIEVVAQLKEAAAPQSSHGSSLSDHTGSKMEQHGLKRQVGSHAFDYPSVSDEDLPSAR